MLRAALLGLVLLLPVEAAAEGLTAAARRDWNYAVRLFEDGLHAEAKEEFQRFAEKYATVHPAEAAEARYWIAEALARLGAHAEAAEAFDAYLQRHAEAPQARAARWGRATAWYRAGLAGADTEALERAAGLFLEILRTDPDDRRCEAEYWLGRTHAALGRPRDAIPYLEAAVTTCPNADWVADAHYALAFALDRGGRDGEAVEAAGAVRLRHAGTPAATSAAALLAEVHVRRAEFAAARDWYDTAHREAAGRPEAAAEAAEYLYRRAWAALRAGDAAGARADLESLVDSYPTSPRRVAALLDLGRLAEEAGDSRAARAWYGRIVTDHAGTDDEARGRYALAALGLATGDSAAALAEAEAVIALGRVLVGEARLVRGRALLALGRHAEAAAAFTEIYEADPAGPLAGSARLGAAEAHHALGDYERAAEVLGEERAAAGRFRLGEILYQLERFDEAIAVWQEVARSEAREDRPVAEEAAYWIGLAHYAARRYADAATALDAFLEAHPASARQAEALYWLGWARRRSGDVEGAVNAFRRCAGRPGPRAAEAALLAAHTLAGAERWSAAAAAYREAADSFPAVAAEAALAEAEAMIRNGRTDESLRLLDRLAGESGPAAAQAAWRGAEILEADSPAQAVGAFAAFAERFPADARRGEALFRAARAAVRAGETLEAEAYLEAAAAETVVAPKALLALGLLRETRGETAGALLAYRRITDSFAASPVAAEARVRAASVEGDLEALAGLLEGDPRVGCLARLEIGRVNLRLGRGEAAARALREALECLPDEGDYPCEAYLLLGSAEEARNRPAAALDAYRRLVRLYPACRYVEEARPRVERLERGGRR